MLKLLIVDDEETIISQMEHMFCDKLMVFTAGYAHEAMEIICKEKLDIVILDIKLGPFSDRSGITVLEKLREKDKDAKVIIVSAIDEDDVIKRAEALGIRAYLKKPFHPYLLNAEIERILREN